MIARLWQTLERRDVTAFRSEEEARQCHILTAYCRLVILLAGLDRITGYEASSFPAGEEAWHCNTRLWRSAGAIPLFQFFDGTETLNAEALGELPAKTVFAVRAQWDPSVLFEALAFAPAHDKALRDALRSLTGMDPEIFCRTTRGCWEIVCVLEPDVSADRGAAPASVTRISFPDPEGRIHDFLKNLLDASESEEGVSAAAVERQGARTVYCSRGDMKKAFAVPEKERLRESALFRSALKALPRKQGNVLCWINVDLSSVFFGANVFSSREARSTCCQGISIFRRVPEGMICWSSSMHDLNSEAFDVIAPLLLEHWETMETTEAPADASGKDEETRAGNAPSAAAATAEPASSEPSPEASDLLSAAFVILKGEAETGNGTFPGEKRAFELLDKMLQQFCYVEGWKLQDNGKLPLLIQRPGKNAQEGFLVLYVDGSCRFIRLEEYRSLKRAAGELHSRHNYSEQDFIRLIGKAVRADRMQTDPPQDSGK